MKVADNKGGKKTGCWQEASLLARRKVAGKKPVSWKEASKLADKREYIHIIKHVLALKRAGGFCVSVGSLYLEASRGTSPRRVPPKLLPLVGQ